MEHHGNPQKPTPRCGKRSTTGRPRHRGAFGIGASSRTEGPSCSAPRGPALRWCGDVLCWRHWKSSWRAPDSATVTGGAKARQQARLRCSQHLLRSSKHQFALPLVCRPQAGAHWVAIGIHRCNIHKSQLLPQHHCFWCRSVHFSVGGSR